MGLAGGVAVARCWCCHVDLILVCVQFFRATTTPPPGPLSEHQERGSASVEDGVLFAKWRNLRIYSPFSAMSHPSPMLWGRAGDGVGWWRCGGGLLVWSCRSHSSMCPFFQSRYNPAPGPLPEASGRGSASVEDGVLFAIWRNLRIYSPFSATRVTLSAMSQILPQPLDFGEGPGMGLAGGVAVARCWCCHVDLILV